MTISLAVHNLSRNSPQSDSSTRLLDTISFQLNSGDRIALQGKSGSGKSLLMRAVVGLDPIDAGEVLLDNRKLSDDWICPFRTRVAYIPQRCALLPGTVRQNLERAQQLQVHKLKTLDFGFSQALAELGFSDDLLDRDVKLLSGGELQLVNLLRSIQFNPAILLLDEPTSAMDSNTTAQVERWLLHWFTAEQHRAWIWISHDPHQCSRIAACTWHMADGKLFLK